MGKRGRPSTIELRRREDVVLRPQDSHVGAECSLNIGISDIVERHDVQRNEIQNVCQYVIVPTDLQNSIKYDDLPMTARHDLASCIVRLASQCPPEMIPDNDSAKPGFIPCPSNE